VTLALTVISGSSNAPLAASVCAELGVTPCDRIVERFADGELHVRLDHSVRGHDVYVVQPTSPPVDGHLMELLFLADACRRAGASRLTAVIPYFGYARHDRRVSGREAVGARVVAELIETAGFSRIVAVDVHTAEIEGFFHLPVEHLSAVTLLAASVRAGAGSVLVAPDLGAVKLAQRYQRLLNVPVAVVHKARVSGSDVAVRRLIGDVKGRSAIIVDDMIATGGTIAAAVSALLDAGGRPEVTVVVTHALFAGPAVERLRALPITALIASNSVDCVSELPAHFQVVNLAPLLADTIRRLHGDQSLEGLLSRT
jgi:ribose-phosphate pyrophosphokinase